MTVRGTLVGTHQLPLVFPGTCVVCALSTPPSARRPPFYCSSSCKGLATRLKYPREYQRQFCKPPYAPPQQCIRCRETKPGGRFELRKDRGKRRTVCNSCRASTKKASTASSAARVARLLKWYRDRYRRYHPCVDCGCTDRIVLEFDHREPTEKTGEVGTMRSLKSLVAEIAKCDIRCSGCHRRKHHRERVAAL